MAQQILEKPAVRTPHVEATSLVPVTEPAPELSVILPSFNERANIPVMVERLAKALAGIDWEVVIVDDNSPDGTARSPASSARRTAASAASAASAGAGWPAPASRACWPRSARYVAVMDADGQHDETLLAAMVTKLRGGETDLVVAVALYRRHHQHRFYRRPRPRQPVVDRAGAQTSEGRPDRSDERLLHASAAT